MPLYEKYNDIYVFISTQSLALINSLLLDIIYIPLSSLGTFIILMYLISYSKTFD